MNESASGGTMTVKQIAEAMGVPRETVQKAVGRLDANGQYRPLGIRVQGGRGGKPRREFREQEVALISREVKRAHNADPARQDAVTDLENMAMVLKSMEFLHARVMDLQGQIGRLAPDAEVARKIANSKGLILPQVAGKILSDEPNVFLRGLVNDGILYRRSGKLLPVHRYHQRGYFAVKERYTEATGITYTQMFVTPKGMDWLARREPVRQLELFE